LWWFGKKFPMCNNKTNSKTTMKTSIIRKCLAGLCLGGVLISATVAQAVIITPATGVKWTTNDTSELTAAEVAGIVGYAGVLEILYKSNVEGGEEEPFAGSYSTAFLNTSGDPADAKITYDGPSAITGSPLYLLVKDGNHEPAQYIFDLNDLDLDNNPATAAYSWNGLDELYLQDFWPSKGAISHVSIYRGTGTSVPDGGATVALMGLALGGLSLSRRFLKVPAV
jgi:hypothetical protein